MENRLKLNKKPNYDLPDEVEIKTWLSSMPRRKQPRFKPDLILSIFLDIKEIDISDGGTQAWIKTDNKELLKFIRTYNWNILSISNKNLPLWRIKKIILEEFYNREV